MLLWPKPVPKRGVDFHSLRHTTATLLLRAGVPAHHVQLILRHADIRTTTQTYGHLMLGDLRKALAALPAFPVEERPVVEEGEPRSRGSDAESRGSDAESRGSVLGPPALTEKESPVSREKTAGKTGPWWRAIQDSNLWPSAPEADALSS
jgi:hypothetical protein